MRNNSHCPHLYGNVLVLTVLSDKYRHYLNVVDENNKINQVQNFRNHVMTNEHHQTVRELMSCTFNMTDEKEFCNKLGDLKASTSNCTNVTELLEELCEAKALQDFVEYFTFFEFIIESIGKGKHKYDFIVLDVTTVDGVDLSWRPSLILQQNDGDINDIKSFTTHSLLLPTDYQHALEEILWKCGKLCWTVITISFGILLIIIVSVSLLTGIAVR